MSNYAKVYPCATGGWEVRCSATRILGIHKTKVAAEAQASAINRRRSSQAWVEPRASRKEAA